MVQLFMPIKQIKSQFKLAGGGGGIAGANKS